MEITAGPRTTCIRSPILCTFDLPASPGPSRSARLFGGLSYSLVMPLLQQCYGNLFLPLMARIVPKRTAISSPLHNVSAFSSRLACSIASVCVGGPCTEYLYSSFPRIVKGTGDAHIPIVTTWPRDKNSFSRTLCYYSSHRAARILSTGVDLCRRMPARSSVS